MSARTQITLPLSAITVVQLKCNISHIKVFSAYTGLNSSPLSRHHKERKKGKRAGASLGTSDREQLMPEVTLGSCLLYRSPHNKVNPHEHRKEKE